MGPSAARHHAGASVCAICQGEVPCQTKFKMKMFGWFFLKLPTSTVHPHVPRHNTDLCLWFQPTNISLRLLPQGMVQPGSGSLAETNPFLIALQMHTDLLSLTTTRERVNTLYSIAPSSFCPPPLLPLRCYSCTSIRKVNSQNQMAVCTSGVQAVENGAICCDLIRVLFLFPQTTALNTLTFSSSTPSSPFFGGDLDS